MSDLSAGAFSFTRIQNNLGISYYINSYISGNNMNGLKLFGSLTIFAKREFMVYF
jgi:hypothetical protein